MEGRNYTAKLDTKGTVTNAMLSPFFSCVQLNVHTAQGKVSVVNLDLSANYDTVEINIACTDNKVRHDRSGSIDISGLKMRASMPVPVCM